MKRIDIILALITGEAVAWLIFGLIRGYGLEIRFLSWVLAVFLPILAVISLWICYLIGKKILWVFQVAKFLLIGVWATLIDLGVLNFLMWISGLAGGWAFNVFKGISFLVATFAKYWGNKFWAFEKMEKAGMGREITQFYVVTLVGLGINVGVASLIVNTVGIQFGMPPKIWANIGAIIAALVAAGWNFIGYKFIVFKK